MATSRRIFARRLNDVAPPLVVRDPDIVGAYLEDASGHAPGTAAGLVRPVSVAEAAAFLRTSGTVPILAQAARSSLTGGAIPQGEVVLSVERLCRIDSVRCGAGGGARVAAGAGVRLDRLQRHLDGQGWYYPPVPTYREAMLGGTVSTNAGGAATFKYGATRRWVRGIEVLLFNGDLLAIERGEVSACRGETFLIELSDGRRLEVPTPIHRLPAVTKVSAGYHPADPLDLVDLFVGAEGTLGVIVGVTLGLVALPPATIAGAALLDEPDSAFALGAALRQAARQARQAEDSRGPDVRAIEWIDGDGLDLLRRDGVDRRLRVRIPPTARAALLFEVELEGVTDADRAQELLASCLADPGRAPESGLSRLYGILAGHGVLERLELAFPGDERRQRALSDLREAVPRAVNELLATRRGASPGVEKVGGDLVVPFEQLQETLRSCRRALDRRGLEQATWGHLGDGNVHPNALCRDAEEVRRAREAMFELGLEAARRGGAPLSEHGVGRSPLKQELLRRFVGDAAMQRMRGIKAALDPPRRFSPGVLFPAS